MDGHEHGGAVGVEIARARQRQRAQVERRREVGLDTVALARAGVALRRPLVEGLGAEQQPDAAGDGGVAVDGDAGAVEAREGPADEPDLKIATDALPALLRGDLSPAEASATKIYGSELATEVYRSLMEVIGPNAGITGASAGAVLAGRIERYYRSALVMTFGGGTNEIQRDIIGYVALGLPATKR